jgi:putative glutamine amidotransferase
LSEIYGVQSFNVNSVHHQGVKALGPDLIIDAHSSSDGIIEAFHHKDSSKQLVMGVQWHPEFSHTLKDQVIDPKPLFDYFLENLK